MNEKWENVAGFEGLYSVSDLGKIKSIERHVKHPKGGLKLVRERIKPQHIGTNGYFIVVLNKNGIGYTKTVHRLIAVAFLGNPENKNEVNHKDGNKLNNSLINLEWNTTSENRYHAFRTGLQKGSIKMRGKRGALCKNSIPVYQILPTGEKVKFESATMAEELIGVSRRGISYCAKGKQPHAGGYKWAY